MNDGSVAQLPTYKQNIASSPLNLYICLQNVKANNPWLSPTETLEETGGLYQTGGGKQWLKSMGRQGFI